MVKYRQIQVNKGMNRYIEVNTGIYRYIEVNIGIYRNSRYRVSHLSWHP